MASSRVCCCLGAGEVIFPNENGHLAGVLGEEHAFLRRGEATAHHKDILPGEELAVAGGAVGHAAAGVLGLALETQLARAGAGGDEDAEGLEVAA